VLDAQPSKNQQFSLLNTFRRERTLLDVFLVSGVRLRGRIRSFDQYSMMLDTGQGDAFLYHHAVSSVGPVQKAPRRRPMQPAPQQPVSEEPERLMRRPAAPYAAPPAPQVTVVRRVSRKITIPRDDS
jgi:host factor-I protein